MTNSESKTEAIVIGYCFSCKHWERIKDDTCSKDMGKCNLLSGQWIKDGKELMGKKYNKEEYPDTNKTGIESYPLCEHDGAGFTYFTKNWYGCVGHKYKTKIYSDIYTIVVNIGKESKMIHAQKKCLLVYLIMYLLLFN